MATRRFRLSKTSTPHEVDLYTGDEIFECVGTICDSMLVDEHSLIDPESPYIWISTEDPTREDGIPAWVTCDGDGTDLYRLWFCIKPILGNHGVWVKDHTGHPLHHAEFSFSLSRREASLIMMSNMPAPGEIKELVVSRKDGPPVRERSFFGLPQEESRKPSDDVAGASGDDHRQEITFTLRKDRSRVVLEQRGGSLRLDDDILSIDVADADAAHERGAREALMVSAACRVLTWLLKRCEVWRVSSSPDNGYEATDDRFRSLELT